MQFYGEDASLCGMEFSLRSVKDRAIKLSFEGFDQKLPKFAKLCIDKIFDCSKRGFDKAIVENSIEKLRKYFTDMTIEADNHSKSNMNLILYPHTFHSTLIAKELSVENPSQVICP